MNSWVYSHFSTTWWALLTFAHMLTYFVSLSKVVGTNAPGHLKHKLNFANIPESEALSVYKHRPKLQEFAMILCVVSILVCDQEFLSTDT